MTPEKIFAALERMVRRHAKPLHKLHITFNADGSGMGLYWTVNDGEWPYCHGSTLRDALEEFAVQHSRLEAKELRDKANAIEESSGL